MSIVDPTLKEWATPRQVLFIEAVNEYGGYRAAAKALGLNKETVRESIKGLQRRAAVHGYSPEHRMTQTVPDPFVMKGFTQHVVYDKLTGEPVVRQEWLKPAIDKDLREQMIQAACEAMSEEIPRLAPLPRMAPTSTRRDLCNLYPFTDYHIGMAAWVQETGAAWDLEIAEQLLIDVFERMVMAAPSAHTAVIAQMGDFLHFDSLLPVTPAHRHVLDAAGRMRQIIKIAARVLRRLVDIALMKHERVHIIMGEGNHDETSSGWLQVLMAALYENEPRVTVDDSQTPYYIFEWGQTLLSFHHGHKVKPDQMPLLIAARYSEAWGRTKKRYAHLGHWHHLYEREWAGMKVTQHPTLSAPDAHAARGGWDSEREVTCETYHKTYGRVGRTTITPEMLEAA